ncbi:MAG: Bug family tripartite tricarboxylate transporter substrate binding protein [Hyphomonas sp.]
MKIRTVWLANVVLAGMLTGGVASSLAQSYPDRSVRLVINVAPGGGSDILARKVSLDLSRNLGQTVVVDNKPGAAGLIGTGIVANAAPDGYTLNMISSSHASNAPMQRALPYHPVDSFVPVVLFALSPQVLLTNPKAPFKTVPEMIAYAKANPGKLNLGSSGLGSTPHLSGELLQMMTGTKFLHVPYKGGGPAMSALMAGQIDLLFVVTQAGKPHVDAGRLRALGVASTERLPQFPGVPTIAESGVAGYTASNWAGILAPAGTPAAVVKTVHDAVLKTTGSTEMQDWMVTQGLQPVKIGTEEFRKILRSEIEQWTKVVKTAGIESN